MRETWLYCIEQPPVANADAIYQILRSLSNIFSCNLSSCSHWYEKPSLKNSSPETSIIRSSHINNVKKGMQSSCFNRTGSKTNRTKNVQKELEVIVLSWNTDFANLNARLVLALRFKMIKLLLGTKQFLTHAKEENLFAFDLWIWLTITNRNFPFSFKNYFQGIWKVHWHRSTFVNIWTCFYQNREAMKV